MNFQFDSELAKFETDIKYTRKHNIARILIENHTQVWS